MAICTFFGHRDAPSNIKEKLTSVLTDLIINKNVDTFYVGNHGHFDIAVKQTLKSLKNKYPHIVYMIVLAYLPTETTDFDTDWDNTIYPEGLETVPKPDHAADALAAAITHIHLRKL